MIRWYDYIAAFAVADLAIAFLFNVPLFGPIAAYLMIFHVWGEYYCERRLMNET